jgi:DNA-binding NtrC family response regulator
LPEFPQVVSPGETARELGIRDARIRAVGLENLELRAELESCQAGQMESTAADGIQRDFSLHMYLEAQERAFYARALAQAGGDATEAARLLALKPRTFRARAATFGLRQRAAQKGRTTA